MLIRCFCGVSCTNRRILYLAVHQQRWKSFRCFHNSSASLQASLYIHWPYCLKRCSYCNFNKYISRNVDNEMMTKCLVDETQYLLSISGVSKINSVFFGGGTPSLAEPYTIAKVIKTIKDHVTLTQDSEISMEVNPTHLETRKLLEFKHAGINRVSVGVQSLRNTDLAVLGREHTIEEAIRCVSAARQLFPGKVSIDMIFGRPGQTVDQWNDELQEVLKCCDHHVSLYQLTLERGTQLFKLVQEKKLVIPDSDVMAEMYRSAVEILESSGLNRYEVSNFATKNAESLHNRSYWEGRQYIGVGPGAHGRFVPTGLGRDVREARVQTLEPDNWMFEVEKYGHATRKAVPLTKLEQLQELVSLGLRLKEGITTTRWVEHQGDICSLRDMFANDPSVANLISHNFINLDDSGLRATSEGLSLLDSIIPYLLNAMTDYMECSG